MTIQACRIIAQFSMERSLQALASPDTNIGEYLCSVYAAIKKGKENARKSQHKQGIVREEIIWRKILTRLIRHGYTIDKKKYHNVQELAKAITAFAASL